MRTGHAMAGGRVLAGARPAWRSLAVLALALGAASCTSDGQPMASFASSHAGTVAFESIDGPPQPIFQKLVENLATESVARRVPVISRESTPDYRVRGYMAAHVEKGRIHIGWVWDVYDANKRRVLRIADEEVGAATKADAWNAADDGVLRRIAHSGMDRLAAFLGSGGAATPPVEPPDEGGARVAAVDGAPGAAEAAQPAEANRDRATARRAQESGQASALAAALALADTRP